MKKATFIISFIALAVLIFIQCEDIKSPPATDKITTENEQSITPVALPSNIVPGFNFPEDSNTIYGWTNDPSFANSYDSASIYQHAWGIWAGLTAPSGQTFANNKLLVYETWLGLSEVQDLIIDQNTQGGCAGTSFKRSGRAPLTRPTQFGHAARSIAAKTGTNANQIMSESITNQWTTVSYSPGAACFATENQIFRQSVINKHYRENNLGAIPTFPNNAITIKPVYLVYENEPKILKLPVWITAPNPANANFSSKADNFVFIDPSNSQPSDKQAVPVDSTETDPTKIAAATINLNEFIYLIVDQQMANEMNRQDSIQGLQGKGRAQAGQIAVMIAMHVTTKEISNWTWQSYYWTFKPENPGSPSSDLAASLRPSQITGAPANYACVAAYVMLTPNDAPNNEATGSMFGYNPYLEGGFGPNVFSYPNTYNSNYQYGVQSNCASCHALAVPHAGAYSTDQTIDLKGDYFFNKVSLDFAWSIQTALINDTTPYWNFNE